MSSRPSICALLTLALCYSLAAGLAPMTQWPLQHAGFAEAVPGHVLHQPPHLLLSLDPMREMRRALDVMQSTWFALSTGTWPTGIDWTRAVLDTHLVATAASLGRAIDDLSQARRRIELENESAKYFGQNIAYYFGEDASAIRHQAYDDMLWVVLGWLESVRFIDAQSHRYRVGLNSTEALLAKSPWHGEQFIPMFAQRAWSFWNLTTAGWDTDLCGGGMLWNPRLAPYKNAITNQLFIAASVGMYLYFPESCDPLSETSEDTKCQRLDQKYLSAAIDGYDWLKSSGMVNKKGLYVDGFHVRNWKTGGTRCNERNEMVYTYNQGVILSGLRGLWESTGNRSYLNDGHELARNAIRATGWDLARDQPSNTGDWAGLGRNGILEDHCDARGNCNQDAQSFKGIFMHHLTLLCEPLPLTSIVPGKTFAADVTFANLHRQSCLQYSKWLFHNAEAALRTRDHHERFGGWWGAVLDAKTIPLPPGAKDYRNDASVLSRAIWKNDAAFPNKCTGVQHGWQCSLCGTCEAEYTGDDGVLHRYHTEETNTATKLDQNDRGRGRTVETQSGGLAVLRALWELQHME